MEPEKASTRMKTKKTKMLISFKNTFCRKNRQIKHKSLSLTKEGKTDGEFLVLKFLRSENFFRGVVGKENVTI